jgi:hypothetical protein
MFSTCELCPPLSQRRPSHFVVRPLDPATVFTTFATVPSLSVAIRSSNETLPALSGVSRSHAWPTQDIKSRWSPGSVKVPVQVESRLKTPIIQVNPGKSRLIFFSIQSASLPPAFELPGPSSWGRRSDLCIPLFNVSAFQRFNFYPLSCHVCQNVALFSPMAHRGTLFVSHSLGLLQPLTEATNECKY